MSLFPSYSRNHPRFSAFAEAVLRQAADLIALIPSLESGFSVDQAVGVQLDILGSSLFVPRQEGWDDETYRAIIRRKMKRVNWDGRNATVQDFLEEGESVTDNDDWTVTVQTPEPLPLPECELLPVPMGIKVNRT